MRWFRAGTRERATEVRPRGREWRERKEYVEEGGGEGEGRSEARTRVIQRSPGDWIHLPPWFKGDKTASAGRVHISRPA